MKLPSKLKHLLTRSERVIVELMDLYQRIVWGCAGGCPVDPCDVLERQCHWFPLLVFLVPRTGGERFFSSFRRFPVLVLATARDRFSFFLRGTFTSAGCSG